MKEKINDKISEIETYLEKLIDIVPDNFEDYSSNYEKKWSCERGFENIIEALTDLAFLIIKYEQLKNPFDDLGSFEILAKNNFISNDLYNRLKQAKGRRNIIAHEYGKIDDELVFEAISSEVERDARDFLESVKKLLNEIK